LTEQEKKACSNKRLSVRAFGSGLRYQCYDSILAMASELIDAMGLAGENDI
jgi:hypothetical protein